MKWLIIILIGMLMIVEMVNATIFNIDNEVINVSVFANYGGIQINSPAYSFATISERSFGYTFNQNLLKSVRVLSRNFTKLGFTLNMSAYTQTSHNPYMLERPLGYTIPVTNQIGQLEEREVKRFLSFEDIFNKEHNLFNITTNEVNVTICLNFTIINLTDINMTRRCLLNDTRLINITTKQQRDIGFSLIKQGTNWIAEFFNLFDLDPSFIDDTDSNWDAGTFFRMFTAGTGTSANLSANNISGHFASQVFDSVNTNANWTNITIVTEAPYGIEIGRAMNDSNTVSVAKQNAFGFINTSGLVGLWHFNNESAFGENATGGSADIVRDFSPDVNSQRAGGVRNNGTTKNGATINKTNYKFGGGAGEFDGVNDFVSLNDAVPLTTVGEGSLTISVWAKSSSASITMMVIRRDNSNDQGAESRRIITLDFANEFQTPNQVQFSIYDGTNLPIAGTSTSYRDGNWHHLVGVRDIPADQIRLYIDGALITQTTDSTTGSVNTARQPWTIAVVNLVDTNFFFDGTIDELAIFNRSLSANEIRNLYKRGAYRLNLSVRSCDDSVCAGESYVQTFTNLTNGSKQAMNLSRNRYFQYNITYSNESAYNGVRLNVNNVSIEFENVTTGDTTVPIINGTLNATTIISGTALNATFNMTDESNSINGTIVINNTGANRYFNFSFVNYVAGNTQQMSQNFTISESAGTVINITGIAIDNASNRKLNQTIFTISSADTCTYTSGDWDVLCTDNCNIASEVTGDSGKTMSITGNGGSFISNALIRGFSAYKFLSTNCNIQFNKGYRVGS